jgi:hypothetical protein
MWRKSVVGNDVQVIKLPRAALVAILGEGVGQRLVVCEDYKLSSFQHMPEVLHCLVDGHKFSVIGAVLLLRRVHLLRKECQRLPGVPSSLL